MFDRFLRRVLRRLRPNRRRAEALVTAFYRTLLMREPDAEGLASFSSRLAQRAMTVEQVLEELLRGDERFRRRGELAVHYHGGNRDAFFAEQSQFGEVSELLRAMVKTAAVTPLVVDVGVRRREHSNSYDLLRWFGWRGLLIEANAALNDRIKAEFGPLDYRLINFAVSDYSGTATFHIGSNDAMSSLNEASARTLGPTVGSVTVQVERLPEILRREGVPERFGLLSIDIEGEDIKVLNDLIVNSPYRPDWILFESGIPGDYVPGMLPLHARFDTEYVWAGKTYVNLLFRHRALPTTSEPRLPS